MTAELVYPREALVPMTIGGKDALAIRGETIETFNPATGELLALFPAGDAADVDRAVEAAAAAFESWKKVSPRERTAVINAFADTIAAHADELVALDVAENGTPVKEMRLDVGRAVTQLRYFAGLVLEMQGRSIPTEYGRLSVTVHQPFGVVGKIIPFNHPLLFAAARVAAPLAAGNTVVLKPSEFTSLSALRLGELSRGILPDGVLNVVTGDRRVGEGIARHPGIRRVAFIGSVPTGLAIQQAAAQTSVKNVSLELGGKNPLVVFSDADLDSAVGAAVKGMNFTWQGQSCGSMSRLLVQRDAYDEVVSRLATAMQTLVPGAPEDPATDTGSLIHAAQHEKVNRYIGIGRSEGARLVTGGETLSEGAFAAGHFVQPTLFADVDPASRLAQEEIFGPVLAAMPFDTYDEALAIANGVQYGLTASVFTSDIATGHRFARDAEAGYVWINDVSRHFEGSPFGGTKNSGIGRDEGIDELYSYAEPKFIHVNFGG